MTAPSPPEDAASPAPERRRLRTDVFLMVGTKMLTLVLGIVTSVVLARALGPSDRGTFAVATNFALLLVQIGGAGLTSANPYFVARKPADAGRIVVNALWVAAGIGTLLFGTGLAVKAVTPGVLEGVGWTAVVVACVAVPLSLGSIFLQSILLGQGRTIAYNGVETGVGIGALVALVVVLEVFDLGVVEALMVMVVQQGLAAALFLFLLRKDVSGRPRFDAGLMRRMVGYAAKVYVAQLLSYLVIRIDMLLVNGTLGAAEAGQYAVAVALADGLVLIPIAVGVNLFPRVAEGGSTEDTARVFRAMGLLFGAVCLVAVPLAGLAIRVLYGEAFDPATTLFLWLLPGVFSLGMLTILAHHFAGRGYPIEAVLVWFIGLGANIAINVAFLKSGGTVVAAIASSFAYALLLLLHARMFKRETGSWRSLVPRPRETVAFVRIALSRSP